MTAIRPNYLSRTNMAAYAISLMSYCKILIQSSYHDSKKLLQPGQTPAPLAAAYALGTMLSFLPLPVVDTLLVGIILARSGQVNKPALLAARLIWNDIVVLPLYVTGFRLGMTFLGTMTIDDSGFAAQFIAFLLGVVVLSTVAALAGIVLIFGLFRLLEFWRRNATG